MRPARGAALAVLLAGLLAVSGCFGGGKRADDQGNDGQGDGSSTATGQGSTKSGTAKPGGNSATGSGTRSGTSSPGSAAGGPGDDGTATAPRAPDVWFNGSRMDLAFRGNGAVLDVLFEATVGFTIHAAVATQDPAVILVMVPETPAEAACQSGVDGPLVASGQPWLDSMGHGDRAAGRYRFVYQMPSSASVGLIIGDVTLPNAPLEVQGQATNATIEVRAGTWGAGTVDGPTDADDAFTATGRIVVAAGARMDYDASAGERRAANDLDVDGAACAQGERLIGAQQAPGLAGSIEDSVAAIVRDADVTWLGSLFGVYAGPDPSGGLVVVHLND